MTLEDNSINGAVIIALAPAELARHFRAEAHSLKAWEHVESASRRLAGDRAGTRT